MSRLIIPYNVLLVVFCVGTTLLLLSSPHHVDTDFLIVNTASLVIFPLTAYFLNKTYSSNRKSGLTITLLLLTSCILFYYIRDFLFDSVDGISTIILLPFTVLFLTILFVVNIFIRRKEQTSL
jgi:SNF family Na+-dependent transporter